MASEESNSNYKLNEDAIKKVEQLMEKDSEDIALKKWKEQLLGSAASSTFSPKDDPRTVVITELTIVCKDRPEGDIVYRFDDKHSIEKLQETPFTLKEGCLYKTKIKFRVQHELVTGLKWINSVSRMGAAVEEDKTMIGSFPPRQEVHVVEIPNKSWEEAPKGMLARGTYKGKVKFVDDDNKIHAEYTYKFHIKSDWKSGEGTNDD